MAVVYVPIDGEEVSGAWIGLLRDIRNIDGVPFNVNEGHRTMARQAELVREKGLWSPSNPTGAAFPSANAPHIRTGRADHAIDFDNAGGVIRAAFARGVVLRQTVMPHEPWHLEVTLSELKGYNARRSKVIRGVRKRLRGARARVKRLASLLKKRTG